MSEVRMATMSSLWDLQMWPERRYSSGRFSYEKNSRRSSDRKGEVMVLPVLSSLSIARIGVFASLYAVLSLVPLTPFIGASSLLALNIIITPTIALLLSPYEAFLSALAGSLVGVYIAPASAIFGIASIAMPVTASTLGSLAYHKRHSAVVVTAFLFLAITFFLMNVPFIFWIVPHVLALILASSFWLYTKESVIRLSIYAFITTMVEQSTMMVLVIVFLLDFAALPWQAIFPIALPFMIVERVVGTVGSTILSKTLTKVIPRFFS